MSDANVKRVKSSEIEFKDRLVSIQRVTKVTKGGRTFSFSAIVVVGNENGVVGYGLGKAKARPRPAKDTHQRRPGPDDAGRGGPSVPVARCICQPPSAAAAGAVGDTGASVRHVAAGDGRPGCREAGGRIVLGLRTLAGRGCRCVRGGGQPGLGGAAPVLGPDVPARRAERRRALHRSR